MAIILKKTNKYKSAFEPWECIRCGSLIQFFAHDCFCDMHGERYAYCPHCQQGINTASLNKSSTITEEELLEKHNIQSKDWV